MANNLQNLSKTVHFHQYLNILKNVSKIIPHSHMIPIVISKVYLNCNNINNNENRNISLQNTSNIQLFRLYEGNIISLHRHRAPQIRILQLH